MAALPYCMDPTHTEDTLFIIAEADWRIYAADCEAEIAQVDLEIAAERYLSRPQELRDDEVEQAFAKELLESLRQDDSANAAAAPSPPSAQWVESPLTQEERDMLEEATAAGADITAGDLEIYTPLLRWSNKEGRPMPAPTDELQDIVAYCNAAARVGRGNCVWLGWNATPDRSNPPPKRPQRIANWSNCIAITAKGARWLHPKLLESWGI